MVGSESEFELGSIKKFQILSDSDPQHCIRCYDYSRFFVCVGREIFAALDVNGDGAVTEEEFVRQEAGNKIYGTKTF
jgi:hypothetical protein